METVTIDAGTLTANLAERIVTGLLLPFGEECRSNLGRFAFDAGVVELPADLTGMSFNSEHERERVIGAPLSLHETSAGVVASFKIANTPDGDAALEDIASGKRKHLSAEVSGVKIKDGKGIAGKLFAAALVAEPAFPSATLLAAAADTVAPADMPAAPAPGDAPVSTSTTSTDEIVDEHGVTHKRTTTTVTTVETDANGNTKTTITDTQVIEEPGTPPADQGKAAAPVAVPNTLTAGKVGEQIITNPRPVADLGTIYASIAALRADPTNHDARTLLAALSDIKISGSGALPASGVLQPNWLGQLNQGIPYQRQYITLGKQGTDISAAGKKGFKVHRGTVGSPVDSYASTGDWAGNKAAIGSGTGFTETATSSLNRFAFGDDIAREFYDLPGGADVIEAFLKLIVEDHLVWSDEKALTAWVTAAGAPVAPGSYPTEYAGTLGMLIQGVLAVKAKKSDKRRDKPSFAILNEAAFEELSYTPFQNIPEYIKFSVATDGTGLADGDVRVVVGDIGISNTPAVLVGADYAIEFDEIANGPLWIDALAIANGGIDKALHGYLQTFPVRTEAVVLVGTEDD